METDNRGLECLLQTFPHGNKKVVGGEVLNQTESGDGGGAVMDNLPRGGFTLLLAQGVVKSVLGREQVNNRLQAFAEGAV